VERSFLEKSEKLFDLMAKNFDSFKNDIQMLDDDVIKKLNSHEDEDVDGNK